MPIGFLAKSGDVRMCSPTSSNRRSCRRYLDAIAIRVLIIKGRLRSAVRAQRRDDAKALEPGIGAKQFIDGPILEGEVLQPVMARTVGIRGEAG